MINFFKRLSKETLAIFLFHGVVERDNHDVRNYNKKHIERDVFYNFLKEIKAIGTPLSIDDVVEYFTQDQELPPNAFAITFDDGFENNYSVAAPVLTDLNIPATFYLTSGFIENNTMSWIDRIEHCIENCQNISLQLPWGAEPRIAFTVKEKIRLLDEIREQVKKTSSIDVDSFVEDVFKQCRMPLVSQSDDPLDKKMNWRQARELSESSDFIIGGHTHTHRIMSFLSHEELDTEIETSLQLISQNTGQRPVHYSYPEGLAHCYSDIVIKELQKRGIVCCPTAIDGVNALDESLFHLKRIMV